MTTEGVLVRRLGDIIQSPGSFDIIGDKVNIIGMCSDREMSCG